MAMNNVEIDGVRYVPQDNKPDGLRLYLVCVDNRGLLFVGYCNPKTKDDFFVIHEARCVISWGTKNHVAELCNGPTESTKLGAINDVTVKKDNVVYYYEVNEDAAGGRFHE